MNNVGIATQKRRVSWLLVVLAAWLLWAPVGARADWSPAADMGSYRLGPSAAALTSGRVLVAGGYGLNGMHSGAEEFNPATNGWSPVGGLAEARYFAGTARLPNGRVLVAGGQGSNLSALQSTEIYNPATKSWSAGSDLPWPRTNAETLTLLDGRVLIVGGSGPAGIAASGAVFDPATGRWSEIAPMSVPRASSNAVLLPSGKVFVVGGWNEDRQLASAEIYDPATNRWSPVGAMASPRSGATATVLPSGRVLVANGVRWAEGPDGQTEYLRTAVVYHPGFNTWSTAASTIGVRVSGRSVRLANGKVLVVGGDQPRFADTTSEVYSERSNRWTSGGATTQRFGYGAALQPLPGNRILLAGGLVSSASRFASIYTIPPPETTIRTGPSGPTKSNDPSFAFSSSEAGSSFRCRLDRLPEVGTSEPCTGPKGYVDLPDGAYTFRVWAVEPSGVADSTPATRSFRVDTVAAETSIASGPSGATKSNDPAFSFTSSETGSTFRCRLDRPTGAGVYEPCPGRKAYVDLPDGAYTLRVVSVDPAGNVDSTPAVRTFRVDTVAPETSICCGPYGTTRIHDPSFGFTSTQLGSTFRCRLDRPTGLGAYAPCAAPTSYANLPDGTYTFRVYAVDPAGNADSSPAVRTFTVVS